MKFKSMSTAVVLAAALALPVTSPTAAAPITPLVTAVATVSGVPLAVSAATKPKAVVSATYTTLPTGKVRLVVTSNAKKVQVKYRTAKNAKRALNRKLKRATVTITLPVGAKTITVRAKATSKLATSPWTAATPPAPQPPAPQPPAPQPPAPDTAPPGPVTGLAVSAVTSTSISLSWTNPVDADLASVIVNRSGGQVVYEGLAGTFTDTGLTPDTTYLYLVYARDTTGNQPAASSWQQIQATTGTAPDVTPPGPVGNLRVSAVTANSVSLAWDYSGAPPDLDGFVIRRGQQTVGTVTGRTFTESSLAPSTTYQYTVVAVDQAGNESLAETVSATTNAVTTNSMVWGSWFADLANGNPNTFDPEVVVTADGSKGLAVWAGTTTTRFSWWNGTTWTAPADLPSMGAASFVDLGLSPDGNRATLVAGFSSGTSPVVKTWQNGQWSAGTIAYQPPDGYHVEYPRAAFSGDAATAVIVWSEVSNTPGTGTDRVMAAAWNGTAWTTPTPLSADVPHFSLPHVAISADGTSAVAAWTANTGTQASQWDGASWTTATTVVPSAAMTTDSHANVAMAADGSTAAAIISGSGNARTSVSLFDGTAWSSPVVLSAMGSGASISLSQSGDHGMALWLDRATSRVMSSTLANSTWNTPTEVASLSSPYTAAIPDRLVLSADGTRAVSVWRDGTTLRSAVHDQGTWTAGKTIGSASSDTYSITPTLAISGAADARTVAAAWIERDPVTKAYSPTLGVGAEPTP